MSNPTLKIEDLSFVTSEARIILNHISLEIAQGDFLIVLGSNGSGKSSLFRAITRALTPTQGRLLLQGKNINEYSEKEYTQRVVILSQFTNDHLCLSMTIREHVQLYLMSTPIQLPSEQSLVDYLNDFNLKFAQYLESPVQNLSGGEKQVLALALCLLRKPDILLLDEHTSALDPKTSQTIMEITAKVIQKQKVTCLMTTHELSHALNYGNRLIALQAGEIHKTFDGTQKAALTANALLAECYT